MGIGVSAVFLRAGIAKLPGRAASYVRFGETSPASLWEEFSCPTLVLETLEQVSYETLVWARNPRFGDLFLNEFWYKTFGLKTGRRLTFGGGIERNLSFGEKWQIVATFGEKWQLLSLQIVNLWKMPRESVQHTCVPSSSWVLSVVCLKDPAGPPKLTGRSQVLGEGDR